MTLKPGTIVILVFDTDRDSCEILDENIKFLKGQKTIRDVICITQVKDLEDELLRSCSIKEIKELIDSRSNSDFKKDMLHISNLKQKLDNKKFDFNKFWCCQAENRFRHISNEASKVKRV